MKNLNAIKKVLIIAVLLLVVSVSAKVSIVSAAESKIATENSTTVKSSNTSKKKTSNSYKPSTSSDKTIASANKDYKKGTYHVAQDGTGDFTNLSSAVVLVPSGSTLIVHEGIYNEALNILGKVINMKGTNRDKCVIQFDTANYSQVPLYIASGVYENLTIKGYHKSEKKGAFTGYAIHIDSDTLAGQAVVFSNCNIISENAFCVGIGLRRGAKVAFRGCNFNSKKQGAILFHDSQTPSLAGSASLSLEGCIINNSADGLIVTQCLSPASTTTLTLRNNTVFGNGDGYCYAYGSYGGLGNGWMGAQNVILTKNSAGNNIKSFNYADMAALRSSMAAQATKAAQDARTTNDTQATQAVTQSEAKPNSKKFYTIINEYGQEINVPAEMIDGPGTTE